jgi:aspartate kinase
MVYKFGGASIKDANRIKNVCSIISDADKPLIVIVSALGKTTNALEEVVKLYFEDRERSIISFKNIVSSHLSIANDLGIDAARFLESVNEIIVSVDWLLEIDPEDPYDYVYDQVVSVGELMSTKLLNLYLQDQGLDSEWLDIRDVIITDDQYRDPKVIWERTQHNVDTYVKGKLTGKKVIVTQGFIGSTTDNNTTTLGREGSDYTGAILSYSLDAEKYTIWKDVEGVLTGDPRIFENVTKLDSLSYAEAIEMTYYGAKVIHPKTIKPLQNKAIPLEVRSFLKPEITGTTVSNNNHVKLPPIVVIEPKQALIHFSTNDFSFIAENHLKDIFAAIVTHRIRVNLMRNTAISFSICVNDVEDRISKLLDSLKGDYKIDIEKNLELVTIRHYNDSIIQNMKADKIVLFEESLEHMIQMVVRNVSSMTYKSTN